MLRAPPSPGTRSSRSPTGVSLWGKVEGGTPSHHRDQETGKKTKNIKKPFWGQRKKPSGAPKKTPHPKKNEKSFWGPPKKHPKEKPFWGPQKKHQRKNHSGAPNKTHTHTPNKKSTLPGAPSSTSVLSPAAALRRDWQTQSEDLALSWGVRWFFLRVKGGGRIFKA